MSSIEKEFISYEQALALKELGFNEMCLCYYFNGQLSFGAKTAYGEAIDAPLYQQVFKFFREKYDWYLDLGHSERVDFYYAILKNSEPIEWRNDYSTYEEAENACIDKLIEICLDK